MKNVRMPLTNTRWGYIIYSKLINRKVKAMPCCCNKKTNRSNEQKKKLLNRLKRIEGQVRGIINMVEQDAYCNDILIQSAAVNAAMNSFNKELLTLHIHSCVVRDIKAGDDSVVDELTQTLMKLMK